MSTAVNSFDVSKYIPATEKHERPQDLVVLTPGPRRGEFHEIAVRNVAGFDIPPSALPMWAGDLAWQKLPRGIPWTEFPIVCDPHYVRAEPTWGRDLSSGTVTLSRTIVDSIIAGQTTCFYDEAFFDTVLTDREILDGRFHAIQVHRMLLPGTPFYGRLKGEDKFTLHDPQALEAVTAGWHRYRYSYRVNFRAIAFKALDHVLKRYPVPQFDLSSGLDKRHVRFYETGQKNYFERQRSYLDEPFSLQILFNILHASSLAQEKMFKEMWRLQRPFEFGTLEEFSFGPHIKSGYWVGSGKPKAKLVIHIELERVIFSARTLGLIEPEGTGRIKLTEAGEAFLDCMHTDNYDPDAFLRFMDPETLSMPSSEIERIDAWMMRFFRKMKTKVNAIAGS